MQNIFFSPFTNSNPFFSRNMAGARSYTVARRLVELFNEQQKRNSGPIPFEPLVLEDLLRRRNASRRPPVTWIPRSNHHIAELNMEMRYRRAAFDCTVKIQRIEQEMLKARTDQLRKANADLHRRIARLDMSMREYRKKYVDNSQAIRTVPTPEVMPAPIQEKHKTMRQSVVGVLSKVFFVGSAIVVAVAGLLPLMKPRCSFA